MSACAHQFMFSCCVCRFKIIFFSLLFPHFLVISGRRKSVGFLSSNLSCPLRPPPSVCHTFYYSSISTWFPVFLPVSCLVLLDLLFFFARALLNSLFLTCPYHLTLFSVILFTTDATESFKISPFHFVLCSLYPPP